MIAILGLSALGVLAGVDMTLIRLGLLGSVGLLAGAWCIVWYLRDAEQFRKAAESRPEEWYQTLWNAAKSPFWIIFLISAGIAGSQRARPPRPPVLANCIAEKREASDRYWNSTVARMHTIRFDLSIDDQVSAANHSRQRIANLRAGLTEATSAPTDKVDVELVQMVRRHLQIDRQMLGLSNELVEWWEQNGKIGGDKSALKTAETFEQFMLNARGEEIAKLPTVIQSYIKRYEAIDELYDQALREVLVMQITLRERYKPKAFSLPAIADR